LVNRRSNKKSGHDTVSVAGAFVDMLRTVAPCFGDHFLPPGNQTLLNAIRRTRALVPRKEGLTEEERAFLGR
jgi:hypothetical protein